MRVAVAEVLPPPSQSAMREKLPGLAERLDHLDPNWEDTWGQHRVLATRRLANELVDAVQARIATNEAVVLDFTNVSVASAPFLDEILRRWHRLREVTIENANEDVQVSWEIVLERRA